MTGKVWKVIGKEGLPFHRNSGNKMENIFIITFCISCAVLITGNPVPKPGPTLTSRSLVAPDQQQRHHQEAARLQLPKPSQLSWKIGTKCESDVSMELITCKNIKHRKDLPEKQPDFDKFQQAVFVNISGGEGANIRLEDFKNLFPNLVSLTIMESPGTAASLINLERTATAGQWEMTENLVPKSLLQDPHFAKRFNLNYFSNGNNNGHPKPTQIAAIDSKGGKRGERSLISQNNRNNLGSIDKSSSGASLISSRETDGTGSNLDDKTLPGGDYLNDNTISDSAVDEEESNDIFVSSEKQGKEWENDGNDDPDIQMDEGNASPATAPEQPHKLRRLVWPSVRILNLNTNELTSDALPDFLGNIFPNLEELYLANNYLTTLDRVREADWTSLQKLDISGLFA